jgi:hypothetical protein
LKSTRAHLRRNCPELGTSYYDETLLWLRTEASPVGAQVAGYDRLWEPEPLARMADKTNAAMDYVLERLRAWHAPESDVQACLEWRTHPLTVPARVPPQAEVTCHRPVTGPGQTVDFVDAYIRVTGSFPCLGGWLLGMNYQRWSTANIPALGRPSVPGPYIEVNELQRWETDPWQGAAAVFIVDSLLDGNLGRLLRRVRLAQLKLGTDGVGYAVVILFSEGTDLEAEYRSLLTSQKITPLDLPYGDEGGREK